jgi:AraC-like DNA-binding protein
MLRTLKTSDWFPADGFPISVERRDPQADFPPHKHEFSEIVLVTGGEARHVVGQESWTLSAGDVFVIGGAQGHAYRELKELRLINILFQPDKLQLNPADLQMLPGYHALFSLDPEWRRRHAFRSRLRLTPRALAPVVALVDRMEAELTDRAPGFGFLATALFMQIVGYLSRSYEQAVKTDSHHLHQIAKAITHLETHAHQPVNLDKLAALTAMSKRNLIRAFRDATGVPPIAYLIQTRINRAATRLRSSDDSITDIAFQVGFSDGNYFTRQFTRQTGLSPRKYRQVYSNSRARPAR